jgi:hypothetical protein
MQFTRRRIRHICVGTNERRYADRKVAGSTARCIAMLEMLKEA